MEKVYPLMQWLSTEEAVDWLQKLTSSRLGVFDLINLCDSGHCDIYVDLMLEKLTNTETGMDVELCGEGKIVGALSCTHETTGAPLLTSGQFTVECDAYGVQSSKDAEPEFIYGKKFYISGKRHPLFKPTEIQALADKMNLVSGKPVASTTEQEVLRQQLERERSARIAAEAKVAQLQEHRRIDANIAETSNEFMVCARRDLEQACAAKEAAETELLKLRNAVHAAKEKPSYRLAVAALLELMSEPNRTGKNQSGVQSEILQRFKNWRGLSQRNLDEIFSEANKAAKDAG